MKETEFRSRIVSEALSWVGTPYRLGGRVKGAGTDCACLILGVLQNAGVIPPDEEAHRFSQDWWQHTTEERYKLRALRYAVKTLEAVTYRSLNAQPGDILLLKAAGAKLHNHGAIVIAWPWIVHAIAPAVQRVDATRHAMWQLQTVEVLSPWERTARDAQEGAHS